MHRHQTALSTSNEKVGKREIGQANFFGAASFDTRSRGEEEQEGKGTVPSMPSGAFVKEEDMPSAARYRQGEGRGPTHAPPDAFV